MLRRIFTAPTFIAGSQLAAFGAGATTTLYIGDEAEFLSAAGGGLGFESFESLTPDGVARPAVTLPGFILEDTGTGQFQNDVRICPAGFCESFSAPTDGSVYILTSGEVTFTFNTAVNAVSFTASDFTVFPAINLTTNAGDSLGNLGVSNFGTGGVNFIGLINDSATFTTLTVSYGRDDDSIAIDEVRFGTLGATAIAAPTALSVLGLGLFGLGVARRRFRRGHGR
jgi:hypothetical protein